MPKYQPRSEDMTSAEKMTTKVGSLTLQYPTLLKDNYASCAIKMKVYMKAQDVWDAVEPATGVTVEDRKDQMALAAIYQGIPEETLMVIAEKQTAKEAWETLKTMHLGADRVRNAKVQTLKSEFELLRMKESDNVDDFSTKLTGIVNKIRALGGKMQESYIVSKLLRAVPERFLTIVSTIEQFGDIDRMSLEEVIGRLKAHEERARVFRDNVDDHLLLTHAEWQASAKKNSDGSGRGRARGAGRWRGRGQAGRGSGQGGQFGHDADQGGQLGHEESQGGQEGRGGFDSQGGNISDDFGHGGAARQDGEGSTRGGRDKSNIKCFNCGVYGHFRSECHKQRRNYDQEAHLTRIYDEEPALMMAVSEETPTVILLNEEKVVMNLLAAGEERVDTDVWYLDNGASNHMTSHLGKFKELDEKITGTVKFDDGSAVEDKVECMEGKVEEEKLAGAELSAKPFGDKNDQAVNDRAMATENSTINKKSNSSSGRGARLFLILALVIGLGSWLFYVTNQPEKLKLFRSDGGPPATASTIQLRDGRFLAYSERGVDKELARFKIMFCHGFGSSRLDGLRPLHELVEELGVYMVGYDRAGYGGSDSNPRQSPKSEALDIQEKLDSLGCVEEKKPSSGEEETLEHVQAADEEFTKKQLVLEDVYFDRSNESKHIDTGCHFIRKHVEQGQIKVEFVCTREQRADILTKALAKIKFIEMRELLGVRDLESRPD